MKTRYIVIFRPFFGIVPVFYTKSKAAMFCAGMRQHLMNIYPKDLGYSKVGYINKSPSHSIISPTGHVIYNAEICLQEFDPTAEAWINI